MRLLANLYVPKIAEFFASRDYHWGGRGMKPPLEAAMRRVSLDQARIEPARIGAIAPPHIDRSVPEVANSCLRAAGSIARSPPGRLRDLIFDCRVAFDFAESPIHRIMVASTGVLRL